MKIDIREAIEREIEHLEVLRFDIIEGAMDFLKRDLFELQHWRDNIILTREDFERFIGALDMARHLGVISEVTYKSFKNYCDDAYDEYYEASLPEVMNEV